MLQPRFLQNFALGLFLGATFAFSVAWLIDAEVSVWLTANAATIFAGLVTLIAAASALAGVLSQLEALERHRQEERTASLRAAKSTLPLALAHLSQACEAHFKNRFLEDEVEAKFLDVDAIGIFKDCIAFAAPSHSARLSEILALYQILHSRSRNERLRKVSRDYDINENRRQNFLSHSESNDMKSIYHAFCWLQLKVLCDALFEYARGAEKPEERQDMHIALVEALSGVTTMREPFIMNFSCISQIKEKIVQGDPNFRLHYLEPDWLTGPSKI